jgi:hypothetical protein
MKIYRLFRRVCESGNKKVFSWWTNNSNAAFFRYSQKPITQKSILVNLEQLVNTLARPSRPAPRPIARLGAKVGWLGGKCPFSYYRKRPILERLAFLLYHAHIVYKK